MRKTEQVEAVPFFYFLSPCVTIDDFDDKQRF